MNWDRRNVLAGGLGLSALAVGPRESNADTSQPRAGTFRVAGLEIPSGDGKDQTAVLQRAIDAAAANDEVLELPAGRFGIKRLEFRTGSALRGVPGKTVLEYRGGGQCLTAESVSGVRLDGLTIDGIGKPLGGGSTLGALFQASKTSDLVLSDCRFAASLGHGISLSEASGRIDRCRITDIAGTALFSQNAKGLSINDNVIGECGNNGIQVWRSALGDDGTIIAHNRIENIRTDAGGSGQNGNGINVFRAGSVLVTGNRISDCAFSAIRGNAASNAQIIGNSCSRLGEVAMYAEFGFEGAIVANNLIDEALTGISVTNFNEGGRLAVVQGNLVRNLKPGSQKSGHGIGIGVEADTMVSANVVEGAPGIGIQLGWGKFLRDVTASGNIVRKARIGIGISADPNAGYVLVTNNMISGTSDGAIRAMDHTKPLGPDLTKQSAESYRNMAVLGNVGL